MSAVTVFIALALVLFALGYITKRKFGILGIGLAAGAVISMYAADMVASLLEQYGVIPEELPVILLAEVGLILLPAAIFLVSGPKSDSKILRLLGSVLFAILATAFVLTPLASALVLDEASRELYAIASDIQPVVIIAGVGLTVFDMVISPSHSRSRPKKKAEH